MTDENGSVSEMSLPRKSAVSPELLIVWAVGALLVPAIMLGVISVWVIVFAISVAWHFRVHLQKLNDDIDAVKDLKDIPYRRRFYGLCAASILSVSGAFILAYALYKFELITWEGTQLRGLDAQLDVFNQLSAISFASLADPFSKPELLLFSISSLHAYAALMFLFIFSGFISFIFTRKVIQSFGSGSSDAQALFVMLIAMIFIVWLLFVQLTPAVFIAMSKAENYSYGWWLGLFYTAFQLFYVFAVTQIIVSMLNRLWEPDFKTITYKNKGR